MCKLILFVSITIIAVSNNAVAQQNDFYQPQSLNVDACFSAPLLLGNWHALSPLLLLPILGFSLWGLYRLWESGEPTSSLTGTRQKTVANGSAVGLASVDEAFLKDLASFDELVTPQDQITLWVPESRTSSTQTWSDIEIAADLQKSPVEFLWQLDLETTDTAQDLHSIASVCENSPLPQKANDVRDDLTKIHGLGKASQRVLNDNEICSFAQVASMTPQQLDTMFAEEQKRFQLVDKSTWPSQAQRFIDTQSQEVSAFNQEMEILDEIDSLRATAAEAMTSTSAPREEKMASSRG